MNGVTKSRNSIQIHNSQTEGDSGSKVQSNRTSRTESLTEKQAVRIQGKRTWGPDSSTNTGVDSLCNMDQSLPLFGCFLTSKMRGFSPMMQHPPSKNMLEFLAAREMGKKRSGKPDSEDPGRTGLRLRWAEGASPWAAPQHQVQ